MEIPITDKTAKSGAEAGASLLATELQETPHVNLRGLTTLERKVPSTSSTIARLEQSSH